MTKIVSETAEIGGRKLTLEIGRFANQATAAVLGKYGETMVLVTVVESSPREDLDYFPLTVDYIERLYAGGRIKGSRWVKREGRTSDSGVLAGRLIDRSVRPLFPKYYNNEVQITVTTLSVDLENDPDILAAVTASAALTLAGLPWNGPVGAVSVGLKEGIPFINPTNEETAFSDLDLVVSATSEKVVMLEAGAKEVSEELVAAAIKFGKEECQKIVKLILQLKEKAGVKPRELVLPVADETVKKEVKKVIGERLEELVGKVARNENTEEEIKAWKEEVLTTVGEEKKKEVAKTIDKLMKEKIRSLILTGERPDGRKLDEVREIECEISILPRTHGSAMFRRGQSQVLAVTTLGTPSLHQLIESAQGEEIKRYIHHYSMPPYANGETGRIGGPNRREIGHGALAERALEPVIPGEDKFPYTIRVVSEVLSSNGSTSMASTCGSTLSLMDAGVPITAPVSGIAMGLVTKSDEEYVILTDIAGYEDFNGDMDFKVAGTQKGITAIQMDVKISGLTQKMVEETLAKAKIGREYILGKMLAVLPNFREKISQYAPRVVMVHIPPEKIGEVIGPGGRMIRKIMETTGAQIDIEDDGTVSISGVSDSSVAGAVEQVEGLTREVKAGDEFEGEVKRIQPFGAFVEILPGRDGLVHVSEMSTEFVGDPSKVVSIGQKVKVRVKEIDEQHRVSLSMLFGEDANKPRSRPTDNFQPRNFSRPDSGSRFAPRPGYGRSRFGR